MNIISDFSDIARRMNRKSEPGIVPLATPFAVSVGAVPQMPAGIDQAKLAAAVKTLQSLGYTYHDGAEMWKPPIGNTRQSKSEVYEQMKEFLKVRSAVSSADVVKAWKQQMGYQMMMEDLASGRIRGING